MKKKFDVIVIGGGASGMMAAGRAAERGKSVLLLEKNGLLGVKLSITGGGRCNICNAEHDVHRLLSHFGKAKRFLYSSFSQFGVPETFAFFESRKLPLKIEALQRVFPRSEKASDVVRILKRFMVKNGVQMILNTAAESFVFGKGRIRAVKTSMGQFSADSFIIATGGKSHPETGSTGDAFRWLKDMGHAVQNPTPSVVPLAVKEKWITMLAGITLRDVRVTFFVGQQKRFSAQGNVLCTHFGLSGPTILNTSKKVDDLLHEGAVTATIDLFPKFDEGALDRFVTNIFDENKNKELKNVFSLLTPQGSSKIVLGLIPEIDSEKKVHSITKIERKKIVFLLKQLPATITGLMGFERAVVADGGIAISEIEGKTMRSRKYGNLFVTGDMLNINRPSGGFSLQLCWTTGWVAGSSV